MDKISKELFTLLVKAEKGIKLSSNELETLLKLDYVNQDGQINQNGLDVLEPYKVKKAVIMAAGFGSRMVPLTLSTPKPLVKVKGTRFIDTLISRLLKVGIKDITIVRGYLKEKFDDLLIDYPFLKFIDNDKFDKENNISSAILVTDLLQDCYLCESDFFITGDEVIEKYQYETNYLGSQVDQTDDWCFDIDENGRLINYRKGGNNCIQAYGISYWNKCDGLLLKNKLQEMYSIIENRQEFWEMCIFNLYQQYFSIKPRLINKSQIIEIDSLEELKEFDPDYFKNNN